MVKAFNVQRFILIEVPPQACTSRILVRKSDPVTGKIYNLKTVPPPPEILSRLVNRELDVMEDMIKLRLKAYDETIGYILCQFKGKIQLLNGAQKPELVFADLKAMLDAPLPVDPDAVPAEAGAPVAEPKVVAVQVVEKCVICMDEEADFLIIPCGHKCGCRGCLNHLKDSSGKCPICRTQIQSLVQVFSAGIIDTAGVNTTAAAPGMNSALAPHILEQQTKIRVEGDFDTYQDEVVRSLSSGMERVLSHDSNADAVDDDHTVTMTIAPAADIGPEGGTVDVVVTINPPQSTLRKPVDVCCLVDISGSMDDVAEYEGADGQITNDGLNLLDVAKHAVKTVAHMLNEHDRLSIVAYDGNAEITYPCGYMTPENREVAVRNLLALQPRGSTNIWGGLVKAMDTLRAAADDDLGVRRLKTILLLTDGQPNVEPPKGRPNPNPYQKFTVTKK